MSALRASCTVGKRPGGGGPKPPAARLLTHTHGFAASFHCTCRATGSHIHGGERLLTAALTPEEGPGRTDALLFRHVPRWVIAHFLSLCFSHP